MKTKLRVLLFPVGLPPEERLIPDTLSALRELIGGGWLDTCRLDAGVLLFCDEDGIAKGMPPNVYAEGPHYMGAVIHGPAFVCRMDAEGENKSLLDEDVERWRSLRRPREVAPAKGGA